MSNPLPRDNPAPAVRANILILCPIAGCLVGHCAYSHYCTDSHHVGKGEPIPSDGFGRKVKALYRNSTCLTCCAREKLRNDIRRENPEYSGRRANWSQEKAAKYLKTVLTQYLSQYISC